MSQILGFVLECKGQRARVKVDKEHSTVKGLPQYLDCWNAIEAKPGLVVEVEMRATDHKRAKMVTWGIPACSFLAGCAFGNAMSIFFEIDRFWPIVASAIVWLFMGWSYASNFKRDAIRKGEQPVISNVFYDEYKE